MTINGVVIGAFNTSSIHILAVTAAGGSGAGVGAATATVVEQAKVQAIINSGAKINRTAARQGEALPFLCWLQVTPWRVSRVVRQRQAVPQVSPVRWWFIPE